MKYRNSFYRPPSGPLVAKIGTFAVFIGAQGNALYSIHRQVRLARR